MKILNIHSIFFVLLLFANLLLKAQQEPLKLTNMFEEVDSSDITSINASCLSADGYTYIVGTRGNDQTFLLKISPEGNLVWTNKYDNQLVGQPSSIIISNDGNYIFITNYIEDIFQYRQDFNQITKLDTTGNVIWSKQYDSGGKDVKPLILASNISNNRYYIVSEVYLKDEEPTGFNIYEIDGNGVVINDSIYENSSDLSIFLKSVYLEENDTLHIVYNNTKGYGAIGYAKVDNNLSLIIDSWAHNSGINIFDVKVIDSYTYLFGSMDEGDLIDRPYLIKLDSLNNIIWDKYIDIKGSTSQGYLRMDASDNLNVIFADDTDNNYVMQFDSGGNVLIQKKMLQLSDNFVVSNMINISGEDYFSISSLSSLGQIYNTTLNSGLYHCNLVDVNLNLYNDSIYFFNHVMINHMPKTTSVNFSPAPTLLPFHQYSICFNQDITECENCIPSFSPEPGKYLVSVWAKEENPMDIFQYSSPEVYIEIGSLASFSGIPEGEIIEGWQKIEYEFEIPPTATLLDEVKIYLKNNGLNDVYFDDLRIQPVNASMKTYVYDPATMRLKAILDENNYATFYEYDKSGKLERVKKETNRGIFTIQESRQAVVK